MLQGHVPLRSTPWEIREGTGGSVLGSSSMGSAPPNPVEGSITNPFSTNPFYSDVQELSLRVDRLESRSRRLRQKIERLKA